jgi:uncharacterized membrane protein
MLKSYRGAMMRVGVASGLIFALYAFYIELKFTDDADFVASCDISEYISCTGVLSSEYSRLFSKLGILEHGSALDLPNALYGRNLRRS